MSTNLLQYKVEYGYTGKEPVTGWYAEPGRNLIDQESGGRGGNL
jgi:hypothetical protein